MDAGRLRIASLLLACGWMATIFYLSSLHTIDIDLGFSAQDKLLHMGAYGLLGILILGAMRQDAVGVYGFKQIALATVLTTLYGLTDEWHQSYVPGRTPDAMDIVADFLGALTATLVASMLLRRVLRQRSPHSPLETGH